MARILFNDALALAAVLATDSSLPAEPKVRIVRDLFGRIRFAIDCTSESYPESARIFLENGLSSLGAFATKGTVIFQDDFSEPSRFFNSSDWHETTIEVCPDEESEDLAEIVGLSVLVLDRQIIGQDWLRPQVKTSIHPYRIVFYGLKGGVGRSTALTMVAYGLAREGKRVLLIDFDLESPGLSGLLLSAERVAEYGIIDWFVEDAVGQSDLIIKNMVSDSQLAESTAGAIRVAAAMGQNEVSYLSKLARVYGDVPTKDGAERFASRMQRLVSTLEEQEKPDVVLIDSRAGLHDVAAVAITSLADVALLFATDSAQNWSGYHQLFTHWQHHPRIGEQVRERLAIVQALAPKSDREGRTRSFQQRAYELFSSTLYDEIAPPSFNEVEKISLGDLEPYNPPMEDESAPHFPVRVDWDDVFQEFNPTIRPEQGGVSNAEIDAKFGNLVSWVKSRISGAKYD